MTLLLHLPVAGLRPVPPGPAKPLSLKLNIVQVFCFKKKKKRHYILDYTFPYESAIPRDNEESADQDIILGSCLKPTLIQGSSHYKWHKYYGNLSSQTLDTSSVNAFKLPLRTYRSHIKDQAGEEKGEGTVRKGGREKRLWSKYVIHMYTHHKEIHHFTQLLCMC